MVELEIVAGRAPSALLVDEATTAPVPLVHGPADGGRDVARGGLRPGLREILAGGLRETEAAGLEPLELLGDGVFDDGGEVGAGDGGAEERLEPLELVAQPGAGGELDAVAAGGERLDARRGSRRGCNTDLADSVRTELGTRPRRIVPTQARLGRGNGVAPLELRGNCCVWTEFDGGSGNPVGARSLARRGRSEGRGLGQLPDESRRIGTGRELGRELLDLALRAVGGPREDGVPVVGGEVRGELGDGGEVEPPVGEHGEEDRVLARRPGGGDAQVGFGLGEVEPLGAVGEHGRRGLAGVEPACIGLGDVRDEFGFVASRLAQDVGEAEEDLAVGELLEGARGFHKPQYRQRLFEGRRSSVRGATARDAIRDVGGECASPGAPPDSRRTLG